VSHQARRGEGHEGISNQPQMDTVQPSRNRSDFTAKDAEDAKYAKEFYSTADGRRFTPIGLFATDEHGSCIARAPACC
jgi:hypothetical protein